MTSAYRTVAQQYLLRTWFEKGLSDITAAAKPGLSNHEDGLALDIPDFEAWRSALENEGWSWLGENDKVHFTFIGEGVRDDIGDIGVQAFQRLWNKNNPSDHILVDGIFGTETAKRIDKSPADGFNPTRLLRLISPLMQGDDVLKIQQALVKAGFFGANSLNGVYDIATASAIAKFQEKNGLSVDSIVGMQTRRKLGIL